MGGITCCWKPTRGDGFGWAGSTICSSAATSTRSRRVRPPEPREGDIVLLLSRFPAQRTALMKSVLIALLGTLPLAASAADNPDQSFYKKAAEAGMAEVQAGQMAQEKGMNPAV